MFTHGRWSRLAGLVAQRRIALAVTVALRLAVFLGGCGKSRIEWPQGTGYVSKPEKRPASPHDVEKTSTNAQIVAVSGDQFSLGKDSLLEIRESRSLLIFPGATITYSCKEPEKLEIKDYNGDKCLLPYGITVRVDEYGQFVPARYKAPK